MAVACRPQTYAFGLQVFALQLAGYSSAFFQPLLTAESFAAAGMPLPLWAVGLVGIPSLALALATGPRVNTWAERRQRRVPTLYAVLLLEGILLLAAAALLFVSAAFKPSSSHGHAHAEEGGGAAPYGIYIGALVCFVCANVVAFPSWGIVYSMHASVTPPELRPLSIAFVNMLGNLGGLLGPSLLGIAHDFLGPFCAEPPPANASVSNASARAGGGAESVDACPEQHAWGVALLTALFLASSSIAGAWGCRRMWMVG